MTSSAGMTSFGWFVVVDGLRFFAALRMTRGGGNDRWCGDDRKGRGDEKYCVDIFSFLVPGLVRGFFLFFL
jgi:hypothetical protein